MFFLFPTKSIILNQNIFALIISVATSLYYGKITGLSVAIGCSVTLLPFIIFDKVFFSCRDQQCSPNQIVKRFYLAAMFKFIAIIILFISALQWVALEKKMFFLAFVIMQISCWTSYIRWLCNEAKQ